MITRRLTSHVTAREAPHDLSLRAFTTVIAACGGIVIGTASGALAQATSATLATDAAVLSRGTVRIRLLTAWTRYDELFGVPGVSGGRTTQLAAGLATDSLGTAQIPTLGPTETAIRTLSGATGFRLTAGRVDAAANARVVTSPLVAEYGLTNRLTVRLVVPLVQTRTTLFVALNRDTGRANVGPNPALLAADQRALNATLVDQFRTAATTLQSRLTACQADPNGAMCGPIRGNETAAQTLIQSSNTFANGLESLYGTSEARPGQVFVPLEGTTAQRAITARIAQFDTSYRAFLGAPVISGSVAGAQGPAARRQLQELVTGDALGIGRDSLSSTDRAGLGDISIGATFQSVNTFGDSARARRLRVVLDGALRLGTGHPGATNRLFDIGTGYGQMGVDVSAAGDLQVGRRLMITGVGRYSLQLGSIDVNRVANPANAISPLTHPGAGTYSAGNVLSLALMPRLRLASAFSLDALYAVRQIGADRYTTPLSTDTASGIDDARRGVSSATEHQAGFGFAYSTVMEADRGPGRLPIEVAFSHVESVYGTGGPVAKTFRDQLELRVYFARRR